MTKQGVPAHAAHMPCWAPAPPPATAHARAHAARVHARLHPAFPQGSAAPPSYFKMMSAFWSCAREVEDGTRCRGCQGLGGSAVHTLAAHLKLTQTQQDDVALHSAVARSRLTWVGMPTGPMLFASVASGVVWLGSWACRGHCVRGGGHHSNPNALSQLPSDVAQPVDAIEAECF